MLTVRINRGSVRSPGSPSLSRAQPAVTGKRRGFSHRRRGGISLTPVPQAGVPIPPIRPLLCQPLNYFFSLPGLPIPDAARRTVVLPRPENARIRQRNFNSKLFPPRYIPPPPLPSPTSIISIRLAFYFALAESESIIYRPL